MSKKLVTVITSTVGHPRLVECIKSVQNQTYEKVQHLIMIDGLLYWDKVKDMIGDNSLMSSNMDLVYLPYSTGKNRYNGHRNLAAGVYLADGEYIVFLDDDNYLDPSHIATCVKELEKDDKFPWTFSLRNIVDADGTFICRDDCESLGHWPSVINPSDYFVDVNCYFLKKEVALKLTPLMHRKFREPGQPEIDRIMCSILRAHFGQPEGTMQYTVNYRMGGSALSVKPDFFIEGNKKMLADRNGVLPWKRLETTSPSSSSQS